MTPSMVADRATKEKRFLAKIGRALLAMVA
jgi:hypothetical protein